MLSLSLEWLSDSASLRIFGSCVVGFQFPQLKMNRFRPDVWWWGIVLVFLVKGIAVSLPFIFFVDGVAQMYWTSFILRVFSPLMGLGITLITYTGSYVVGFQFQQLKMNRDRLFSVFVSIIYTFYIGIASLSLSFFRCYEHPNGKTSLVEAPSVLCGSDAWTQVIVFAIFAIVVYCIFVFAVFVWLL